MLINYHKNNYMNIQRFNTSVFLTLSLLILMTANTKAQSSFGIRGGLNASTISLKDLPNKSERFGFHVGVFASIPVSTDFMSIQPELSYSTKGVNFKPLNERLTLNMNYVDFLLPVAFHLGSIDVQVGPFASFLASTPDYTLYNDNVVVVDAFKRYDAGLTAGLSYNFNHLLIGIRYNQGFVDVTKDNARLFLGSGKNAVGQVSLGYRF
jgi:Outer membrane protein beta-barrel domain